MGVRAKLSSRGVSPHISIFMSYPVPGKARGVGWNDAEHQGALRREKLDYDIYQNLAQLVL